MMDEGDPFEPFKPLRLRPSPVLGLGLRAGSLSRLSVLSFEIRPGSYGTGLL